MSNTPTHLINFKGPDWAVIKAWAEKEQKKCLARIVGPQTHDETNTIRGRLQQLGMLLALENDADRTGL